MPRQSKTCLLPLLLALVLSGCGRGKGASLPPDKALFSPLLYSGQPGVQYDPATQYRNPILPGFYPDPSICRVGNDYWMVNSTFGYFPGIPVWHSTDLVHWEQKGNVLYRNSQMPIPSDRIVLGVFAPQISYNPGNGLFYVINTIVGGRGNFFVTSADPESGIWSEPVLLPDVKGIDPSILFDSDGRAWIVSAASRSELGETPDYPADNGIPLLEFDWRNGRTVGERKIIYRHGVNPKDHPASLEGPHLYHIGGKYFLMCAEGGTETGHSEVIFSSDKVDGPYTPCAINPILTQRDLPLDRDGVVSCTGHADLVCSAGGQWYAVFLGVEPYEGDYWFNTGRQTFLLPVEWVDGQPVILPKGEKVPLVVDMTPDMKTLSSINQVKAFDGYNPGPLWDGDGIKDFVQFIRRPVRNNILGGTPIEESFSFSSSRKGGPFWRIDSKGELTLSLKRVPLRSHGNPSFVGERITAKTFEAKTRMTFFPTRDGSGVSEAGLVLYQNNGQAMTLLKTLEGDKVVLCLELVRGREVKYRTTVPLSSGEAARPVYLKVATETPLLYAFYYSFDGKNFTKIGESLDAKALSTLEGGGFQGAMVGIYGCRTPLDFDAGVFPEG